MLRERCSDSTFLWGRSAIRITLPVLLKYLFQLQKFCNCRSVILNKKEKCWNDSSLTEERHPGRNDDSLLGELQLELHVYSVYYFQSPAC